MKSAMNKAGMQMGLLSPYPSPLLAALAGEG
jgi:hypothetical protein